MTATAPPSARRIDCDGAFNLRDLGGYRAADGRTVKWRTLFRADGLHRLDLTALPSSVRELKWRTVLDLRTIAEIGAGQYRCEGVEVVHLPLLRSTWDAGAFDVEARGEDPARFLAARYLEMVEEGAPAIAAAFEMLASPHRLPAVFHCSAGKDRTGVLAALVLGVLGVDDDQIADDYQLSATAMDRLVEWITTHRPEVAEHMARQPAAFLTCPADAITSFVHALRERYGSIEWYLTDFGVDRATLAAVRDNLLGGEGER